MRPRALVATGWLSQHQPLPAVAHHSFQELLHVGFSQTLAHPNRHRKGGTGGHFLPESVALFKRKVSLAANNRGVEDEVPQLPPLLALDRSPGSGADDPSAGFKLPPPKPELAVEVVARRGQALLEKLGGVDEGP